MQTDKYKLHELVPMFIICSPNWISNNVEISFLYVLMAKNWTLKVWPETSWSWSDQYIWRKLVDFPQAIFPKIISSMLEGTDRPRHFCQLSKSDWIHYHFKGWSNLIISIDVILLSCHRSPHMVPSSGVLDCYSV